MEMVKKWKWFWPWQDNKEEQWLTVLANQGLHLKKVSYAGIYTFEQGPSQRKIYRLDFIFSSKKDPGYYQLYQDAGWEFVGDMGGWQYFRIDAPEGEEPQIFTDNESKIQKYQRLMIYMAIFMPILFIVLTFNEVEGLFWNLYQGFVMILFLLFVIMQIALWNRIQQLKKKI
jgi:hypothetical protein